MERVSIIMPCYNDGRYLQGSIDSALGQTYPDIELIIVDDGSDDAETLAVLERQYDPRVRVLHGEHLRPAAARNRGIKAASGSYILPLDSDDLIEPDYILRAVAIMQAHPEVGIVYCHADLFDKAAGLWYLPEYSLEHMLLDNVVFVTSLFRRSDWEAVGGFDESMKHGMEDYDFWLSLLELEREVVQLPEVLFHYRIKQQSRTNSFMADVAVVKDTYAYIQRKHRELYLRYIDVFGLVMRSTVINQKFEIQAMREGIWMLRLLSRYPRVKAMVKRCLHFLGRD